MQWRALLEPVFYKGEPIGAIRKFSDTLLMFLAQGSQPKEVSREHEGRALWQGGHRPAQGGVHLPRAAPYARLTPRPDTEEEPDG